MEGPICVCLLGVLNNEAKEQQITSAYASIDETLACGMAIIVASCSFPHTPQELQAC